MSDIQEDQEVNMGDINFDDFENFDASAEMQTSDNNEISFDTSEFDNLTFDEQSNIEISEASDNVSTDFSFDEMGNVDVDTMFDGRADKQEPYFENLATDVTSFETVANEEEPVVEEFVEEPLINEEEPVMEEFVEEPLINEEEPVVEEFVEEPVINDDVSNIDNYIDESLCLDVDNVGAYSIVCSQNLKYIQWYSGNSDNEVYEFDKLSESAEFIGTKECNTIHVNVGYDTYGWNVQFSDGVVMSLRDVKEYQVRNGKLPNPSGRIVYGQKVLSFDNVERIVVYEAVKYFSYGI
ncbi:MAG: hypothetical protein IKC10_02200 [Alphaproteobacteria bacterium]|nr:hypothetical protein [Alphaproteobacteria bacterium]